MIRPNKWLISQTFEPTRHTLRGIRTIVALSDLAGLGRSLLYPCLGSKLIGTIGVYRQEVRGIY